MGGALAGREALIVTFWRSFEDHEQSHRSETFQPLFQRTLELCENGNEEVAYRVLWSGRAYTPEQAQAAREAKARYATARVLVPKLALNWGQFTFLRLVASRSGRVRLRGFL